MNSFIDTAADRESLSRLVKQNAELEKTNKRQKEFVSLVSHDFKSALTSIVGFSDLMRGTECSPEEIKEFATDIYHGAQKMTHLITDILELERMEVGQMELALTYIHLNALIEEAVVQERLAIPHGIHLHLDNQLPSLNGDADQLTRMVTNLLNKASKYTPDGGAMLVGSERVNDFFHLSIRDQGIDILADRRDEVFAQYTRVASDTTHPPCGTGLELSIAQKIIEMHGGNVWIESYPRGGSIFHVMLPFPPALPASAGLPDSTI
ncbi:MAG: HAMP domain-containing sensor histidine kinase [Ktedonobacteraceae bacterium]|nr:HAMP domain-containing histidine kinase [Chloroflexota bacterium]